MASCEIERPSPKVLFESIKSMFSTTVLGGAPIIPESNEWWVVTNDYAMAEQFYSVSQQSWNERDPRYCCCDNLIDMAAQDGIYPKPARFSSGYIQLTGTASTLLPTSIEATIANQQLVSAGPMPVSLDSSGSAVVRMQALLPGTDGNITSKGGTALSGTLTTVITNVNTTVTVYGGQFCGGSAAEDCEVFRQRYLERMKYKPFIGIDIVKEALLTWPCVTRVCERGGVCCDTDDRPDWAGGIDCQRQIRLYAIFEDTFDCGAAPQNIVDQMQEWLFGAVQGVGQGQAPWGIAGKIYSYEGALVTISVDGMACQAPGVANLIRNRMLEFVKRNCPSEVLYVRDLNAIVAQIVGGTSGFDVRIDTTDPRIKINICGDAEPDCDVRICLADVQFPNPVANPQ